MSYNDYFLKYLYKIYIQIKYELNISTLYIECISTLPINYLYEIFEII